MPDCADRRFWKLIGRKRVDDALTRYRRALNRRDVGLTNDETRHRGSRDE